MGFRSACSRLFCRNHDADYVDDNCTRHSHSWQAPVSRRTDGSGCPYCLNQKVLAGFNDLATLNPALAAEWHPVKNGRLTPKDVVPGSNKKAWWQCAHGHEWEAAISSRVRGSGCPYCSRRKPVVGVNDLATTHPELAEQWDASRNDGLGPQDVTAHSARKVWWTCDCGHMCLVKVSPTKSAS